MIISKEGRILYESCFDKYLFLCVNFVERFLLLKNFIISKCKKDGYHNFEDCLFFIASIKFDINDMI